MKPIVRDTFYLGLYFGLMAADSWALATQSGPQWFLPVGIVVQGLMFVGLMEAFHQAIHMNLYAWRPLNMLLGRLVGAHLGIGFNAYRRFHIAHHTTTNTADDPEKLFYLKGASTAALLLFPFVALFRNANIINRGTYVNPDEQAGHRLDLLSVAVFRIATIGVTVLYPMPMLLAYWLPYVVFFYVELFMAQSQHYFSAERETAPRGEEHYGESVNVRLLWPLGFLCMHTNHHATHHVNAAAKWYDMPRVTRRDGEQVVSVGALSFFFTCVARGGKTWRARA